MNWVQFFQTEDLKRLLERVMKQVSQAGMDHWSWSCAHKTVKEDFARMTQQCRSMPQQVEGEDTVGQNMISRDSCQLFEEYEAVENEISETVLGLIQVTSSESGLQGLLRYIYKHSSHNISASETLATQLESFLNERQHVTALACQAFVHFHDHLGVENGKGRDDGWGHYGHMMNDDDEQRFQSELGEAISAGKGLLQHLESFTTRLWRYSDRTGTDKEFLEMVIGVVSNIQAATMRALLSSVFLLLAQHRASIGLLELYKGHWSKFSSQVQYFYGRAWQMLSKDTWVSAALMGVNMSQHLNQHAEIINEINDRLAFVSAQIAARNTLQFFPETFDRQLNEMSQGWSITFLPETPVIIHRPSNRQIHIFSDAMRHLEMNDTHTTSAQVMHSLQADIMQYQQNWSWYQGAKHMTMGFVSEKLVDGDVYPQVEKNLRFILDKMKNGIRGGIRTLVRPHLDVSQAIEANTTTDHSFHTVQPSLKMTWFGRMQRMITEFGWRAIEDRLMYTIWNTWLVDKIPLLVYTGLQMVLPDEWKDSFVIVRVFLQILFTWAVGEAVQISAESAHALLGNIADMTSMILGNQQWVVQWTLIMLDLLRQILKLIQSVLASAMLPFHLVYYILPSRWTAVANALRRLECRDYGFLSKRMVQALKPVASDAIGIHHREKEAAERRTNVLKAEFVKEVTAEAQETRQLLKAVIQHETYVHLPSPAGHCQWIKNIVSRQWKRFRRYW